MSKNGVVFEPLPPRVGLSTDPSYGLGDILPALRERPDEWARVREFDEPKKAAYIARKVNTGQSSAFQKDFAASVRRMPSGKHALYMRYVGDEGEA